MVAPLLVLAPICKERDGAVVFFAEDAELHGRVLVVLLVDDVLEYLVHSQTHCLFLG